MSTATLDRSKDAVARRLAESHYRVDPAIDLIVRLTAPSEDAESEPVKLLEVNRETSISGIVPVYFGAHPASGVFFPSVIVEVHPEEFDLISKGRLSLPHGWQLAEQYDRSVGAE